MPFQDPVAIFSEDFLNWHFIDITNDGPLCMDEMI